MFYSCYTCSVFESFKDYSNETRGIKKSNEKSLFSTLLYSTEHIYRCNVLYNNSEVLVLHSRFFIKKYSHYSLNYFVRFSY